MWWGGRGLSTMGGPSPGGEEHSFGEPSPSPFALRIPDCPPYSVTPIEVDGEAEDKSILHAPSPFESFIAPLHSVSPFEADGEIED